MCLEFLNKHFKYRHERFYIHFDFHYKEKQMNLIIRNQCSIFICIIVSILVKYFMVK